MTIPRSSASSASSPSASSEIFLGLPFLKAVAKTEDIRSKEILRKQKLKEGEDDRKNIEEHISGNIIKNIPSWKGVGVYKDKLKNRRANR